MPDPYLSPDDENDPLLKWGSSLMGGQQLAQPDIPAMSMPPAAPTGSAPAQAPQNDYGALEALANVGPPPKSDGTANNIAAALAMLADAAFDKGRALGPIMGAWASRKDPELESYQLRLEDAKKRAEIAHLMQGAHGDPESAALRKRALDLQESGQQIQRDALNTRVNGVPGIKDALKSMGGVDPAVIDGMTDQQANALKGALVAQMRQHASNSAWVDRYGPGGMREQTAIATEGRKPDVAAATTAATANAELAAKSGQRGEDQAAAFGKDTDKLLELAHNLQAAESTIAANPNDLPGVGQLDAMKLNNEAPIIGAGKEGIDFRKQLANIRDLLARERSGATFSGREKEDLYRMAAGLDSSSEAEIKSAIQGMHGSVQSMLRARSTGREGPANAVMKNAGVADWMNQGGGSPGEPPSGKVLVQEPAQNGVPGRVGYIPADQLDEALRRGARRIQ